MELLTRKNGVVVRNPTHISTSKNFEREVAKFFGTNRTPLSGMCDSISKADILHDKLFVECKLRADFAIFRKFREEQKQRREEDETKKRRGQRAKNAPLRPLIYRITNYKKFTEDLWLVDHEEINKIIDGVEVFTDDENREKVVYFSSKFSMNEKNKADTIVTLFKEVDVKAKAENKIPIVAIKMKGQRGWLAVVKPKSLPSINALIVD